MLPPFPGHDLTSSTPLLRLPPRPYRPPLPVPGIRLYLRVGFVVAANKIRRDRREMLVRFPSVFFVGKVLPLYKEKVVIWVLVVGSCRYN